MSAESNTTPYNPGTTPWTFEARTPTAQQAIETALSAYPAHLEGFARQFQLLHRAIVEGRQPPVTLDDARASLELITAIYLADSTGQAVDLPLDRHAAGYDGWMRSVRDGGDG